MIPYYDDGAVAIYHGDCREVLPLLEGQWALTMTDPPWKLLSTEEVMIGNKNAVELWREVAPLAARSNRILVWLPCTADPREWLSPIGMPFLRSLMIRRAIPGYYGRVLLDVEQVFALGSWPAAKKGRLVIPGGIEITYRSSDRPSGHPGPRSEIAARWLVKFWSDEGDTVLDPFAGSGTTLAAAKKLGRRAIGIEIEERYCELAARRCSQESLDLFTGPQKP